MKILYDLKKIGKKIVFSSNILTKCFNKFIGTNRGGVRISHKGYGKILKDTIGENNSICIGEESIINNLSVRIRGNNNCLIIGKCCKIGAGSSVWMEGNNIKVSVGDNTTCTKSVHICAQEDDRKITIGRDCMLSNSIIIRTSDSHPIYDKISGFRINPPGDVIIGEHVWIAPGSKVFKGAVIEDGAIIGSDSMVTNRISQFCLAVGHPAKVVKENVNWTREKLF